MSDKPPRPWSRRELLQLGVALGLGLPLRTAAGSIRDAPVYGVDTYQLRSTLLLEAALGAGVGLVDTSPEYEAGRVEAKLGRVLDRTTQPVTVMTGLTGYAWESIDRFTAFELSFERSLNRLRRGHIDVLILRNPDPDRLRDAAFRRFANRAIEDGRLGAVGISHQSSGLEELLPAVAGDPLFSVVRLHGYLARHGSVPEGLARCREAGKHIIAASPRQTALNLRAPGWEREQERRQFAPWSGAWQRDFVAASLPFTREVCGADSVVLSLDRESDVAALLEAGGLPR